MLKQETQKYSLLQLKPVSHSLATGNIDNGNNGLIYLVIK